MGALIVLKNYKKMNEEHATYANGQLALDVLSLHAYRILNIVLSVKTFKLLNRIK